MHCPAGVTGGDRGKQRRINEDREVSRAAPCGRRHNDKPPETARGIYNTMANTVHVVRICTGSIQQVHRGPGRVYSEENPDDRDKRIPRGEETIVIGFILGKVRACICFCLEMLLTAEQWSDNTGMLLC